MISVIGLGNPDVKYFNTRHNAGFMLIDLISEKYSIPINKENFFSIYGIGRVRDKQIVIAKPQTYMNLSGKAAASILSYFSENEHNLIVLHDDIDLEVGRIKVKRGGGDAGHRGLKSITECLSSPDYHRLRIGVGRPSKGETVAKYVLSPFKEEEKKAFEDSLNSAEEELDKLFQVVFKAMPYSSASRST